MSISATKDGDEMISERPVTPNKWCSFVIKHDHNLLFWNSNFDQTPQIQSGTEKKNVLNFSLIIDAVVTVVL